MPNGSQHCDACHGTSTTWQVPTDHTYPGATSASGVAGNLTWNCAEACSGCHDVISNAGGAHIDSMISQFTQIESCAVCHGPDTELPPARMHPSR